MIRFIIYVCLISLLGSVRFINCNTNNKVLYGEPCTDLRTQTTGCCQLLRSCSSAIQDIKNKKLPTICSYRKELPVVCCRGSCPTANITEKPYIRMIRSHEPKDRNNKPLRISEKKCLEYATNNQQSTMNYDFNGSRRNVEKDLQNSTNGSYNLVTPQPNDYTFAADEEIGGVDSKLYEFPHMAALGWYTTNGSIIFSCGGSLISDKYVLTAGHCTSTSVGTLLNQSEPSLVRLGDLNIIDGMVDNASPMDIPIKKIIRHPQYKPPKKYNDIALLELRDKVEINRNILPACLWTENDFRVHKTAISTGWGTTKLGGTENSPVLQKVNLDIINTTICDSLLSSFRNRHWQGVKDDQMCAGVLEGGKDSCQGDSGGPLQVISEERRYFIIGVTSFGKQCAKPNQPGIYVKVSHFVDWIESIVWSETKNTKGDSCTDIREQTVGCCRPLRSCPSAINDLRNKKIPTLCSYKKEIPIICCRSSCPITYNNSTERPFIWNREVVNDTSINRKDKTIRISETKCHEYTSNLEMNGYHFRRHRRSIKVNSEKSTEKYLNSILSSLRNRPSQIGGRNSKLYEFPHMAALGWYTTNGSKIFSCGGSLISDKYVLTAGHCTSTSVGTLLNQSEPSLVRLGDLNIIDEIFDNATPIDIPIKRIIKHPQYEPPKKYNDIALLELRDKVEINRNILPACLWTENDFGIHKTAISTGWGTTKLGRTENSPILQKVDLDIINTTICDSLLSSFRNRHWQGVKDDQMCAGVLKGGKDSCQGDSGGPLQIISEERRYFIIGVTSFGKQCAKPNQPGIYVKVSHFVDWIESIVWPETNNTS